MRKILFLFVLVFLFRSRVGFSEDSPHPNLVAFEDVLNEALKNEPRILMAKARIDKEKALQESVKRGFFPKLKTDFYAALTSESASPGVLFWTSEIELPLFEGGKRIHEMRVHRLKTDEEKLHLREVEQELREEIKIIYIGVLKEKKLLKMSENRLRELRAYYEISRKLKDSELFTEEELLHVKTMLEEGKFEHLKHKEAFDYGESLLKEIVGMPEEENFELEELDQVRKPEIQTAEFFEAMKKENFLYGIMDLKVRQKKEEKEILRSDRFPKLSLIGRFQVSRDNYIDQTRFEAGLLGSWNIWDFGELGNRIKAADYEILEMKEEGDLEIRKQEREAKKLLSDLKVLWGKLSLVRRELEETKAHHHGKILRMMTGDIGKFGVLDSLVSLRKMETAMIENLADYRILEAKLETMKGDVI